MSMAKRLRLSREERARVTALWRDHRAGRMIGDIPGLRDSLASLAEQGYTLEDIGNMFGVSRERIRQWFAQLDLPPARKFHVGYRRSWNADLGRFDSERWMDLYRLCACGCGRTTKGDWAPGHYRRKPTTRATRRRMSAARRAFWRSPKGEQLRAGRKRQA
jgi:hypothetical protein